MSKTLDPKLDITFKLLFADERNRGILIALLTAILRPKDPIVSVKVLNPAIPRKLRDDKAPILDLRLRLRTGKYVHVEMQRRYHDGLRERELFYWAKDFTAQLTKGRDYDQLEPTIGIFLLDFNDLEGEQFHSVFQLLEVHTQQRLTDAIELHVLELRKLPADLAGTSADEQAVLRWCKFLAAKTDEEREQIAMIDPEIRQAKTALEQLSKKRMAQRLAEEREIELNHYYNSLARQREEGRAEGEAKGREEGRAEGERWFLLRQLRLKFGELSGSAETRIQAATEQQLNIWAERVLTAGSIDDVFS